MCLENQRHSISGLCDPSSLNGYITLRVIYEFLRKAEMYQLACLTTAWLRILDSQCIASNLHFLTAHYSTRCTCYTTLPFLEVVKKRNEPYKIYIAFVTLNRHLKHVEYSIIILSSSHSERNGSPAQHAVMEITELTKPVTGFFQYSKPPAFRLGLFVQRKTDVYEPERLLQSQLYDLWSFKKEQDCLLPSAVGGRNHTEV